MEHNGGKKCLLLCGVCGLRSNREREKEKKNIEKKRTLWLEDDEENESAAWVEVVASYDFVYRGADKKKTLCL